MTHLIEVIFKLKSIQKLKSNYGVVGSGEMVILSARLVSTVMKI